MRIIYATPFNPDTLECTGPSTDSGFTCIDDVVAMMGDDFVRCSARNVIYDGIIYSDFKLRIDAPVTSA